MTGINVTNSAVRWLLAVGLITTPAVWADGYAPVQPPTTPATKPAAMPSNGECCDCSAVGGYIRVVRDAAGQPSALEVAISRFQPATGGDLIVDLVGVVHIGTKSYYAELEKRFADYDVVLYELVAPTGTRIPKGGVPSNAGNPIGMLQSGMKSVLKLESQLDQIDYHRSNFVHADLSPDQLAEAMRKRGETPLSLIGKTFLAALQEQARQAGKPAPKELNVSPLLLLFDSNAAVKLRRMMAVQMEMTISRPGDAKTGSATGLGTALDNLLIADRNAAAMRVFGRELAKGRKKIAIFYGAAHMPDFERRLTEDFDLKQIRREWLPAWELQLPANRPAANPALPVAPVPAAAPVAPQENPVEVRPAQAMPAAEPAPPEGFTAIFNGRDFTHWTVPEGDNGHWAVRNGIIDYDGKSEAKKGKDLWTEREFGDFTLMLEWRWSGPVKKVKHPIVLPDGTHRKRPDGTDDLEEIDVAGDSGVYLRGSSKSQVNLWCWNCGSGEVYGYRMDPSMPAEVRAGVTPKKKMDKPLGEWNQMSITMKGDRLTVVLNGEEVISNAQLPGVKPTGKIALQHHGDPIQFRNLYIKELK